MACALDALMNKKRKKPKINIGERYGRLIVLELDGQNKHYTYMWKCLCDCGKTKVVATQHLTLNLTKSCGCLIGEVRSNMNRKEPGRAGFTALKKSYVKSAQKRDLTFELTDEQLHEIFKMNCAYCGLIPKQTKYGSNYKTERDKQHCVYIYNGIDRVDNNIGYIKENCVPCCKKCNFMKLGMELDQFFAHIELIYKRFNRYYEQKKKVS